VNLLGLEAADVAERLNLLDAGGLFRVGDDAVEEGTVLRALAQNVDLVVSSVPEHYRRILRSVQGERVVAAAVAGQSEAWLFGGPRVEELQRGLPDGAQVLNVRLFHNWNRAGGGAAGFGIGGRRPYAERLPSDRVAAGRYTVDGATGKITLVGWTLGDGDTLHADYDHTAASRCEVLRKIALDLTVAQLRADMPHATERWVDLETEGRAAKAQLMSLMDSVVGIDLFDQLDLEVETRSGSRLGVMPRTGAW
jgi:hypothetical protein